MRITDSTPSGQKMLQTQKVSWKPKKNAANKTSGKLMQSEEIEAKWKILKVATIIFLGLLGHANPVSL